LPELQRLRNRLATTKTLLNLVTNVKALAAVTLREQQLATTALSRYEEAVLDALGLAIRSLGRKLQAPLPSKRQGTGMVVFGSDQGLCGTFNHRLADQLETPSGPMLAVGHRIWRELERKGYEVDTVLATPSSQTGAHRVVGGLLQMLERWQDDGITRITIHFNAPGKVGLDYRPTAVVLLPLEDSWWDSQRSRPWESRTLPTCLGPPEHCLKALLRQWMYIEVSRCLTKSRMAEAAARLETMQSAQNNISADLARLEQEFQRSRQAMIDAELLDISAGFESVMKD
jgi:F-type H+-transporting ATPase subunit gamma